MNRCIIIILMVLFTLHVYAGVNFQEGSHLYIDELSSDRTSIQYHCNTDDIHLYGVNEWGVRFVLADFFTLDPLSHFQVDSVFIYVPNDLQNDTMNIRITPDSLGQPVVSNVQSVNHAVTYGINKIAVDYQVSDTLWVLFEYDTNYIDKFVSASQGEGGNSYYKYENVYYPFSYMNLYGELLVTIKGRIVSTTAIDLELTDLGLFGNVVANSNIMPYFTITNYSDQVITPDSTGINGRAKITFRKAGLTDSLYYVNLSQGANSVQEYTIADSISLSQDFSQYEIVAQILCDEDIYSDNNRKSIQFNTFSNRLKVRTLLTECALQWDDGVNSNTESVQQIFNDFLINSVEDPTDLLLVNLFPRVQDDLFYRAASRQRFDYYNMSGYPTTIIGGSKSILGLNSEYEGLLQSYYNEQKDRLTYVDRDSTIAVINDFNFVSVDVILHNSSQNLFSSYLSKVRLYGAVIQDSIPGLTGSVILHLFENNSEPVTLADSQSTYMNFNFSLDDLSPILIDNESENDVFLERCRFIYWLQHSDSNEIDFLKVTDYFGNLQLVGSEDNSIPSLSQVSVYPNPFYSGQKLQIVLNSKDDFINKTEVFNIKGQLVKTILPESEKGSMIFWDGSNQENQKVSSGLYFIRTNSGKDKQTSVKRIMFIK
ncbi:MAG: T9SS type A sorting domain-containing protein [Candidatus Cloacimonetes bacterium]|nr:T9SS type A sorting domain-containing protein [Candidatus Cloacimonadota bacterium]